MKYLRYQDQKGIVSYGILKDGNVAKIDGDLFGSYTVSNQTYKLDEVKLLPPCLPSKIMCIGKNYAEHIKETDSTAPEKPLIFMKPSTSVIGPEDNILHPKTSTRVDYECELAAVIKKPCKGVPKEKICEYILGYTCLNDVSARDRQWGDGQWTRGKSADTFCPIGPVITDEIDPMNVNIQTRLNGKVVQNSNTNLMIFDIPTLIAFICEDITLLPGDVVTTGTPSGIAPMKPGDVVEVEVEGIGVLKNPVVMAK